MRYFLIAAILVMCTGCFPGKTPDTPDDSSNSKTIVWYLPSTGAYKDVPIINDAVNDRIHNYYPDLNIELNFINIHEYAKKISVYLSAGERADIVWVSDSVLPYINFPQDNIYKFLDAPIEAYAPNIHARLGEDNDSLYKIYDKKYFIPAIEHCDGLIPFIRIPAVLAQYMDIAALRSVIERGGYADDELFGIITDYLANLDENKNLRDGVDFSSVSELFPLIGYETFVSTSNLIGYRIDDRTHKAVDMLNTKAFRTSQKVYKDWYERGYIRDDISITYKQDAGSTYRYALSGAWGYEKDGKYFVTMDGYKDDSLYIAIDNKYHMQKLFTQSASIIPTLSKMSEEALKILDLFYADSDLYNLITFGINGTHYNIENDRANIYQNNYRCFFNIVPGAGEILSAVTSDNVIPVHMENNPETAGMFIPSASARFREMLSDYVNTYASTNYFIDERDNGGSQIDLLLDIYNGNAVVE